MADPVLRPRDRHHAHGAREFRDVEADLRGAVGGDADDAGIERDRRLGRRAALQFRPGGIAATANLAAGRLHAVDELAVEIADIGSEPALAEIVVVRRRRLVVRQIEDADIDGGDDEAGLFASQALDLDRHAQARARARQGGKAEIDRKRLRLAIEREPLHPDGAAGHALGRNVERPQQRRDGVAAIAPVAPDRDADSVYSRLHLPADGGDQTVGDDVEHHLAGGTRGHRDHHGVAGAVFRLVERGFQEVRRVGARRRIEAGIESEHGGRGGPVRARHFQTAAAPGHRHRNATGPVGGDIDGAVGDALGLLDRLVVPAAVLPIPLIPRIDPQQLVAQSAARERLAVRRDQHDIERGIRRFAERCASKQRLHADHGSCRRHRQRQLALDGAAARLRHVQRDLRLQRTCRLRELVDGNVEFRLADRVGVRDVLQHLVDGGLLFVVRGGAERVAGKSWPSRRRLHLHVTAEFEIAGRCTIEETPVDGHLERRALGSRRRLGSDVEFHPVGDVVLDHERGLANRGALGIGEDAHPPSSRRGGRRDRHVQAASADALVGNDRTAILDPVRPLHHDGYGHFEGGDAARIAQQRCHVHGLAGAVDPALGIDEGIESRRHDATGDAAVAEIEGRPFQIEKGVIAARIGGDDERRRQPALSAHQPGLEQCMAGGIGAPGRHHFIVARDQADVGLRRGGRARQRIDEDMDAVIAGKRGEAEVGYDEPLGGERIIVFAFRPRGLRRHHIDAWAQIADRLVDRESRHHLGVERAFDRKLPAPHAKAALVGQPLQFIAAQAALEVLADDGIEQVAVADPIDLDGHLRRVDADDRNAALSGAGQHIGLGGEADERAAVADIDGKVRRLCQGLLHRRRQAGANLMP